MLDEHNMYCTERLIFVKNFYEVVHGAQSESEFGSEEEFLDSVWVAKYQ